MDTLQYVVLCWLQHPSISLGRLRRGPFLCTHVDADVDLSSRSGDVAATSPRFRRKSSTMEDAIHDLPEKAAMAPAQLYSTESGRLFHSGRIVISTVGLPARGKTLVSSRPTCPTAWCLTSASTS